MKSVLDKFLDSLEFGEIQQEGNIAVLPISTSIPEGLEYLSLSEAMDKRCLTIREVSEGGAVPELAVENTGKKPILLLDGEELAGAKQNRVLNLTILIKEQWETVIPVS